MIYFKNTVRKSRHLEAQTCDVAMDSEPALPVGLLAMTDI